MFQIPHQFSLLEDNEPKYLLIVDGRLETNMLLTLYQVHEIKDMYPSLDIDYVAASELEEAFAELSPAGCEPDPADAAGPALNPAFNLEPDPDLT